MTTPLRGNSNAKWLSLLLAAMLILSGCTGRKPSEPTIPTTQPTVPTQHATLYVPGSKPEIQSGGAVRVYDLKSEGWRGISGYGTYLFLMGEDRVRTLQGEDGEVLGENLSAAEPAAQLNSSAGRTADYIPAIRSVVLRDAHLQTVATRLLPENITGSPVINLCRNEVYYIVGAEIRAMELDTGVARLLRQRTGVTALDGVYFNGNVLALRADDDAGRVHTEYISAENGQTLGEDGDVLHMTTWEERYLVTRQDGRILQTLFGTRTGEPRVLEVSGTVYPVLRMQGAVACKETKDGLQLSFYDLDTGNRKARTVLEGIAAPTSVYCDGTYIWLLARENDNQRLLRWDISKSALWEQIDYTATFYTPGSPDSEGLAACQTLADTYAQQYGVKINIWQDATVTTGGYRVTAEYRPETLEAMLEEVQPMLEIFPENFLLKTVEAGWIRINLVREIEGGKTWAHFWEGKDCHILLSAEGYAGEGFLRGLAYAVDSHILGNSRDVDFDRWNPLNPAGFAYSDEPVKPEYLTGDTRAFANAQAATSVLEDRSSIFFNGLVGGNTEMFKAPIMQAKLQRLCMGIREAYGLQKSEKSYLWERYLDTPLAYKK